MPTATRHRDLEVRLPEDRLEDAHRQRECGRRRVAPGGAIELERTSRGVAHQVERLPRHNSGDLMLAMAVRRRSREDRDDDLRPEAADDVDDVFEDGIARPEAERFVRRLGVSKVVGAGEKLPRAVQLTRREQLFGADDAELRPELRSDQILPPFSPAQRQVRRLRAHAAGEQDQEVGVLVVGMRADQDHAFVAAELPQQTRQCNNAATAGRRQLPARDTGGAEAQQEPDDESSHYWERYTAPPFITNLTRCSSVISRVGSPATAMMSA